jgi:hypothetical protein
MNIATKTPRKGAPRFFNNKPLGVPWCLRAFVAIFTAIFMAHLKNRLGS